MGTPFAEIYGVLLTVVEDYDLNDKANIDEEEFYNSLKSFVLTGIPEFDCYTSLDYTIEEETQDDGEIVERYYFVETLSRTEIKIIGKIATSQYFKRKVQDVLAYEPLFANQREFKKESTNMSFKEKKDWYGTLVSEYMADIKNYRFEDDELINLPFFGEYL